MTIDLPGVVRVHAYEFGTRPDARAARSFPDFAELRATAAFPSSAAWRARLGGLNARRDDLWRLLDPAAVEGAIVVWAASLSAAREEADEEGADEATRVISLIQVDFPNLRSARWRASLNVRSIVVAEADWQRFAPALVVQAPKLLRDDFDALIEAGAPTHLKLAAPDDGVGRVPSAAASRLLQKMMMCCASEPGGEEAADESDFWVAAGEALAFLSPESRGQVSLASGLAAPFASGTISFDLGRHAAGKVAKSVEGLSPVHRYIEILQDAYRQPQSSQGYGPLSTAGEGTASPSAAGVSEADHRTVIEGSLGVELIERLATRAYSLAELGPSGGRRRLLTECEGLLTRYLSQNDFLTPDELLKVVESPAAAALLRRVLLRQEHAVVCGLKVSLVMMAYSSAASAALDDCLRVLLPPQWSASQWLSRLDQEWLLWRSLDALHRHSERLSQTDVANLDQALVNRLSCAKLAVGHHARPVGVASHRKAAHGGGR